MVQKFIKFIQKSPHRTLFEQVLRDIGANNLGGYDVKRLQGQIGWYRLRVGSVRFVFRRIGDRNMIMRVNHRGDVYKG